MRSTQGRGRTVSGATYPSSVSSGAWEAVVARLALELVAVAVHLQDVDVVGEPIQQGSGQAFRAEHLSPPFVYGFEGAWCPALVCLILGG